MDLQKFEKSLSEKIKDTVKLLEEEWFQISLSEDKRRQRKNAVYNCISDLCEKILSDERTIKERVLRNIEEGKVKLFQLCQELNQSFIEPEDLPLLELESFLHKQISELESEKEQRFSELNHLAKKDEFLCNYLGEEPYYISKDMLPAAEDLDCLRRHIAQMEEEKVQRIKSYNNLRKDILSFIERIEKPLESEMLLDVVCSNEEEKSLGKTYLLEVKKLHSELEFEAKELETLSLDLREKISSLWHLLQVSPDTKDAFLATVPAHSPSCITKLENHLEELKGLRSQNLGRFIDEMKIELEKCWERCHVGEREKKAFAPLALDKVTEEVLESYEKEVNKWKKFYSDNKSILEKVDYFLALFDNMQQLEEKAKDPTRLFNTRGGALLQEEKERKRVKSELPHIQEQLINLCSEYEAEKGHPFWIDGCSIQEYLCKLWDYHDIQREKDKIDRLQNKNKTPSQKGLQSAKRTPLAPVGASNSSRKRGRDADDNGGKRSNKMAKKPSATCCASLFRSPNKSQKPPAGGASTLPRTRVLTDRLAPLPPLGLLQGTENVLHNSISYDNFKEILRSRNENFNSTSLSVVADNEDSDSELTF